MDEKKYFEIELVSDFSCLAGDCPASCCGNWNVAIDDETYKNILKAKGMLGFRLRLLSTYDKKTEGYMICRSAGHCSFYRKHLCELQSKDHMECMPKVCRLYPRRTVAYGNRVETSLELSCIYAAALFIRKAHRMEYEETEHENEVFWNQNNDDDNFLRFLIRDRREITDYWWENATDDWVGTLRNIYSYIYAEYMWIVRDKLDRAEALALPLKEELKSELRAPRIGLNRSAVGLYPLRFLNELIYEYLNYPGLQIQTPALHHLVVSYRRFFGKILEKDSEEYLLKNYEKLLAGQPELRQVIQAYFSYLFNQTYCEAFEDYYTLGPFLLAALHTEFLQLFYLVEYMEHGIVTVGRQAEILSVMEKGVRHKGDLAGTVLERIRNTYFSPRDSW